MNTHKTMVSAGAAGVWLLGGIGAGLILGISLGVPGRFLPLFSILGLALGWMGFTGTRQRLTRETKVAAPEVAKEEPKNVTLLPIEDEKLFGEEARKWLDDFLLKQQGK